MRRVVASSPWARALAVAAVFVLAGVAGPPRMAGLAGAAPGLDQAPRATQAAPGQRAVQSVRPPLQKIGVTRLEVRVSGGDTERWAAAWDFSVPLYVPFRCSTTRTGVAKARWIVANSPMTNAQQTPKVIQEGWLATPPAPNTYGGFGVDFKSFAPPKPPSESNAIVYYVQVVLYDAQNAPVGVSTSVRIRYFGTTTESSFGEDMANPGDTRSPAILTQVYNIVRERFRLQEPLGPATWSKTVPALQLFKSQNGVVSMEVAKNPERVIVAVPHLNEQGQIATYVWYVFQYFPNSVDGWMVGPDRDQDPAPAAVPPVLTDSGAWANYRFYLGATWGAYVDPPHWTPILINDDSWNIANIHRLMQTGGSQSVALSQLNGVREDVKQQDLTDRAMKPWQPVRLNGIVTGASYTSGDFGADHTTGYHDGEDAPLGGYADESSAEEFEGLDWDMGVQPDPAFNYLATKYRPHVGVEIEHFAIALGNGPRDSARYQTYFPQTGDWVQAVGRWVTDNGHPYEESFGDYDSVDGFYTEIHPPEMLVSSRYIDQMRAEARVVVTGAWLGSTLNFVVNPPPRPSADAVLKWDVFRGDGTRGYDRKDKCDLQLVGRGGASPAYLLGTVRSTGDAKILQYNIGMVGMDGSRGLQTTVRVWWEDQVSGASGQMRTASGPARGAHLFYRDGSSGKTPWIRITDDGNGRYSLGNLRVGGKYWLRPGGSGWTFSGVPELWTVPSTRATKDFIATRTAEAVTRALRQMAGVTARMSGGVAPAAAGGARQPMRVKPGSGARPGRGGPLEAVRSLLITFEEPSGEFGVAQNGMGYPESGIVKLQLRGMVDFDGKPVASLQAAYTTESDGAVRLEGSTGPGVANARIRARLLLGNPGVGYRMAQEAVAQTDAEGFAGFRFTAGSRVEDAVIEYTILENPFNPWFTPSFDGRDWTFYPATTRGDVDGAPYRVEPVPGFAASAAARGFVGEARERAKRQVVLKKAGVIRRLPGRLVIPGLQKGIARPVK